MRDDYTIAATRSSSVPSYIATQSHRTTGAARPSSIRGLISCFDGSNHNLFICEFSDAQRERFAISSDRMKSDLRCALPIAQRDRIARAKCNAAPRLCRFNAPRNTLNLPHFHTIFAQRPTCSSPMAVV